MFDLNKFDKNFDEAYESLNLTLTSRELAVWRLLTVAEDFTRIMYMNIGISDPVVFSIKLDEMKYIYKFSINKIYRDFKSFQSSNLNLSTDKKSYPEYFNLILKTIDYKKAVHLMSMLHTNTFSIQSITNNNYHIKYKDDYNISYNMLESIGINKPKTDDFISLLVNFYFKQDDNYFVNTIYEILYENVFLKKRKIKYNFNKKLIKEIISIAGHCERERLHSEVFHYSWGSSDLTAKLIDALIYRCLYHLISIRVANIKYNFIGGFEDSLVLVTEKNKLINDISLISDIKDIEKIKEFLEFLEFPKNLDKALSSDAALQPLFLHQKEYFIPCFHIIESNIERNLMTLFARNDSKNFDKQSNVFEKKMINQIEGNLISRIYKRNYKKRINKKDQEFDFLLIDEINKKILVIELRWMIQPADPREVINKRKACYEKVQKVKEKKKFLLENLPEFSVDLKIPSIDEYSIDGIIVIDGYSGIFTDNLEIPLVPIEIFNIALKNTKDFNHLYNSLCSLEWLPEKNKYFKLDSYTLNNNEYIFHVPGLEILGDSPYKYMNSLEFFFKTYK